MLADYRGALHQLATLMIVHLSVWLVWAAVAGPVFAFLLDLVVRLSGQSAVTDQDIARFILSPAGAVGALVLAAFWLVAAVMNVATMTLALNSAPRHPLAAAAGAFAALAPRLPALLRFAVGFTLRVLGLALPFLALAGVIAWMTMRDYDINYYLTAKPPVFLAGAAGIAVVALVLALVLLRRLSGWAVALHLILIERHPVGGVWTESAARLDGRRGRLAAEILVWLVVRLALAAGVGMAASAVLGQSSALAGGSLRRAALVVGVVLAVLAVVQVSLAALSSGALSVLLLRLHHAAGGQAPAAVQSAPASRAVTLVTVGLAAVAIAGFGLWQTVSLVGRLSAHREVEIIAHRGAAALRPENTLASVRKAIEDKTDWVEIDVQENADGTVVVTHDSDFMKLAGVPTKVWEATDADLAGIDIGSHFDAAWSGERTTTLAAVLAEAKGRARVIVELKFYGHDIDLENKVAGLIESAGMADDVAVMSLKVAQVTGFQAVRPGWRTGLLAATALGDLSGMKADFLAVSTRSVSTGLIDRAHAAGQDVYVWTVDDPVTMSRMISMGVDGLITNNPALARQVVAEQAALPVVGRLVLWLADAFGFDPSRRTPDDKDA